MKTAYIQEMRAMDEEAIHVYGIPSILLMDHAANTVKEIIEKRFHQHTPILILCGPGNNGGDGFALAVQLVQASYDHVVLYCKELDENMSEDERVFKRIAEAYHIMRYSTCDLDEVHLLIQKQEVLVDALFGTGLSRDITGFYESLILEINQAKALRISIDIASGIQGDSGQVMNCAVQSDLCVTFECYKPGQLLYPGNQYHKTIQVESIKIPKSIVRSCKGPFTVLDDEIAAAMLPIRRSHSHKGSYGSVLMIGGSSSMHGAITLAAKAALRSGLGTLTLLVPDCIREILAFKLEESMLLSAPSEQGFFHQDTIPLLQPILHNYDLITIGNGLGRHQVGLEMLIQILQSDRPCILDGDALYEVGKKPDLLKRNAPTIITPHIKEMHYLTGMDVTEIINNPLKSIAVLQSKYPNVTVVLKDEHTLICNTLNSYMNIAGNHGLAKGGSGDVLCGIITGLYAQSKEALSAAACGVYVHAVAADQCITRQDANHMLANDIIQELSHVYQRLRACRMLME